MGKAIKSITRFCGVLIAAAALAGLYGLPVRAGTMIQGCVIELGKETNVETSQSFDFTADYGSASDEDFSIFPGETWRLTNVICESVSQGFNIFVNDNNQLVASCIEVGGAQCFFLNEITETNIPALSEWGMIAAAAGLGLIGLFFAMRRKRTARA